jgi:4-hydroxy-tetrahydrodipicolinate synthase
MYGGNANLYNMAPSEFAQLLELLQSWQREGEWFIPSVGSDYGKALDQVVVAREHAFPTVMVLPHKFPAVASGVATGLRRLADAYGRPVIAYVKDDGYIEASDLGRLAADGAICAIKYAVVRRDPTDDPFLGEILSRIDKAMVISGIGERPAIDHLTRFGLPGFMSGSVCIAPRLSMELLSALRRGRVDDAQRLRELFLPFEDLRDTYSPLRVLHEGVRLAGICDTGPLLPFLANITEAAQVSAIAKAASELYAADAARGLRAA